jgi:hypothetical protein
MYGIFDMKTLLEIIFKYTNKNARILADQYLLKDVSIISKWRNNVICPRNDDIVKIVEFVNDEATISQKELIRDNIEELLKNAPIKTKIKDIIIHTNDFCEFLKEAISVSTLEYERKNILYCSEEKKRTRSIVKKEPQAKQKGAYSGTVELDFILPEGDDISLQKLAAGSEIEFKGKLNLSPKKESFRIAKFFKSSTALGVLLVWLISGTIIAFSIGIPKTNPFAYALKSNDAFSEPVVAESDSNPSGTEDSHEQSNQVADEINLNPSDNNLEYSKPVADEKGSDALEYNDVNSSNLAEAEETNSPEEERHEEDNQNKQDSAGNKSNNANKDTEQTTTNNYINSSEKSTTNNTEINSWNNFNIQISGENLNLIVGEQNAVSIETD